jgi:hypothetical protein
MNRIHPVEFIWFLWVPFLGIDLGLFLRRLRQMQKPGYKIQKLVRKNGALQWPSHSNTPLPKGLYFLSEPPIEIGKVLSANTNCLKPPKSFFGKAFNCVLIALGVFLLAYLLDSPAILIACCSIAGFYFLISHKRPYFSTYVGSKGAVSFQLIKGKIQKNIFLYQNAQKWKYNRVTQNKWNGFTRAPGGVYYLYEWYSDNYSYQIEGCYDGFNSKQYPQDLYDYFYYVIALHHQYELYKKQQKFGGNPATTF